MIFVNSILTIYTWGIVCILLFFLYAIARFYEQKSGRRSFYWAFFIPMALFALAAIRYVWLAPAIAGDVWADLLHFVGGITLSSLGFFLLKLMVGGRT